MQQHFNKAKKLVKLGEKLDSCTKHFQPNCVTHVDPQSTNVEEQPAALCDNATQSVQSKVSPPKTAPCVPKRELQFLDSPDPTTKHVVPADTDHVSMGMQSRPPPSLMSQSMTKAQHTKSSWKHCEDQQKEIVFHLFLEHWPQKQLQQFATNQLLFSVWQNIIHEECSTSMQMLSKGFSIWHL